MAGSMREGSFRGSEDEYIPYHQFGVRGGGRFSQSRPKSDVDWKIYRARQVPGPGAYGAPSLPSSSMSGGRFNTSKPKSDVDWAIIRARELPAPGQYEVPVQRNSGGRFSTAKPKSDLDWTIYRAKQVPGPGEYDVTETRRIGGGRISRASGKSDVDWEIYRASQIPGPGAYDPDRAHAVGGGRFSTAKPKTDVDWLVYRAQQLPAPGAYDVDHGRKLAGGRIGKSRAKTELDWVVYRAAQTPGPGAYEADAVTSIGRRTGLPLFVERSPQRTFRRPDRVTVTPDPSTPGNTRLRTAASSHPRGKTGASLDAAASLRSRGAASPPAPESLRPHTSLGLAPDHLSPARPGSQSVPRFPTKRRSAAQRFDFIPDAAARAYGVFPDARARQRKARKRSEPRAEGRASSHAKPVVIRVRMEGSGSDGRRREGGSRGARADEWAAASPEQRAAQEVPRPPGLTDNAQRLFDMAMRSGEFREIMRLYTGLQDPSQVVARYAEMWSTDGLLAAEGEQRAADAEPGGSKPGPRRSRRRADQAGEPGRAPDAETVAEQHSDAGAIVEEEEEEDAGALVEEEGEEEYGDEFYDEGD